MSDAVREYATEGQRLLCECGRTQIDIARSAKVPKERVSAWFRGEYRPSAGARVRLAQEGICPADAWERPSTSSPTISKMEIPPTFAAVTPSVVERATEGALESYGITGLEAVVDNLRKLQPTLLAKERVAAIASEGRLHTTIANLRAKERDARREYLDSPEFAADMRLLSVAVGGEATDLRAALGRLGVELPAPPTAAVVVNRKPPTTKAHIDGLMEELVTAGEWRAKGEPMLAAGLVVGLCLDVHADAIATVLAGDSMLAGRFIGLLDVADAQIITAALERRLALADVAKFSPEVRAAVAQLLEAHGLGDVAKQVGVP